MGTEAKPPLHTHRTEFASWRSLSTQSRTTLVLMLVVVAGLHVTGFLVLLAFVAPKKYSLGSSGIYTIGVGVTAYMLGMRHAFDADHIAAIDNTTRKLMHDGKRPLSVGFWFSLGHSTVVFCLALLIAVGVRALDGPVTHANSGLHRATNVIGTGVSGVFLYIIAALNLVILWEIVRVFVQMRGGEFDEATLETHLRQRGFMNRWFGKLTRTVTNPRQMYPIGVLFGLGFDTATEVALLVIAGSAGIAGLPWYAILCLPILFAAGMSLLDTIDGSFMTFTYGWAFSRPVRKVFYNLTLTALSVMVALAIGTIEIAGLIASEVRLSGSFWTWFENVDINLLGFIIVGMFLATWAIALAVWKYGRIEERWTAGRRTEAGSTAARGHD